ncbi:MAG: SDR family NAD(P)-dependent oxidoreductase [Chloroflexota bacterium]
MIHSAIQIVGMLTWLLILIIIVTRIWAVVAGRSRLSLYNRWVVVTGCDSGIGKGVMERLIADEANVIALCFTEEGTQAAMDSGAKLAPCLDITDEDALRTTCTQVNTLCDGNLWGIVHNAGIVRAGFIEFQPLENYRDIMAVNFFAIVNLTQQLIPSLKAAQGRVVIVSSVDGIVSLPGNAPYDASKFAVEAYADALRTELSFWNMDVAVVNPSTMRTPLALGFFDSTTKTWEQMNGIDPDGAWKQHWSRQWLDAYVDRSGSLLEQIAQDPAHAVKDIVHALSAMKPKFRYLSGSAAKTMFYALWIMPERWSHWFKKGMISPPPENADMH